MVAKKSKRDELQKSEFVNIKNFSGHWVFPLSRILSKLSNANLI